MTDKWSNSAEDNTLGYTIATKRMSRIAGLERVLEFISDARSMQDVVKNAYNRITV